MPANTAPIFGLTPKVVGVNFANADGTTKKTIYTAGSSGARVISINATTSDTAPNDVNLYIQVGGAGTVYNIGGKRVPLASGDVVASTVASVQLLDVTKILAVATDGSITLGAGDVLQAGVVAAVTTAKTLSIITQAIDY